MQEYVACFSFFLNLALFCWGFDFLESGRTASLLPVGVLYLSSRSPRAKLTQHLPTTELCDTEN